MRRIVGRIQREHARKGVARRCFAPGGWIVRIERAVRRAPRGVAPTALGDERHADQRPVLVAISTHGEMDPRHGVRRKNAVSRRVVGADRFGQCQVPFLRQIRPLRRKIRLRSECSLQRQMDKRRMPFHQRPLRRAQSGQRSYCRGIGTLRQTGLTRDAQFIGVARWVRPARPAPAGMRFRAAVDGSSGTFRPRGMQSRFCEWSHTLTYTKHPSSSR